MFNRWQRHKNGFVIASLQHFCDLRKFGRVHLLIFFWLNWKQYEQMIYRSAVLAPDIIEIFCIFFYMNQQNATVEIVHVKEILT